MPTTVFYILLTLLTVAPFNVFWFVGAIILDIFLAARRYPFDPDDDY